MLVMHDSRGSSLLLVNACAKGKSTISIGVPLGSKEEKKVLGYVWERVLGAVPMVSKFCPIGGQDQWTEYISGDTHHISY